MENVFIRKIATVILVATLALTSAGFTSVNTEAKGSPKLSVDEYTTKLMKEQKNYTIKLSNVGKSKVRWTVKKNRGISSPVLKVVSKSRKKIVLRPLRNGEGTIVCKVGKTRLQCSYSVYLKQQTEEADKNITDDELYEKALKNEIPVLRSQLYYDYRTDSQKRANDWYYLDNYKYKIKDMVDVDNDGKNEALIDTDEDYIYGGIYLDTSDGKVYELARSQEGMSSILDHQKYNGYEWITYSDTSHTDRNYWEFNRYDGYGDPVETFSIGWQTEEDSEEMKDTYDEDCDFYYNDEQITEDDYIEYLKELGLEEYLNDEDK